MQISYLRVNFPSNCSINKFDCPITYLLKKYGLDNYMPIPRSTRLLNGELIAVIPSDLKNVFQQIMDEEDCKCVFVNSEECDYVDFENTYVYELNEKIAGTNVTKLSIVKRLKINSYLSK